MNISKIRIINADVLAGLAMLPDESVQCCVTSPPYWGLRQYFFDKASIIRYNLTIEERKYVEAEIERRGIKPHV
jgi:site-specific DNA-methyltransferase (cytosine-N4-specific)